LPTLRRSTTALGVLALVAGASLGFRPVFEPDVWWHLAQGREIAAGHLVRSNLFSTEFAAYPQPFTSWLFDLVAYGAFQTGGGAGVQLLQAAFIAATLALIYSACRKRAPVAAAVAVLAIGLVIIEPRALPRPHLASFAGLAACVWLIERARTLRSHRPLWWAVPVVALWSNLHAESVTGVALIGLVAAGEWIRPSFLSRQSATAALGIAAACAGATLLTPYGWGLWRYLFENAMVPSALAIAELQRPYVPSYLAFFGYLGILGMAILVGRVGRVSDVLVAAAFAALGLMYLRFTPLVFIVTAPLVAECAGRLIARGIDGRALVATAMAAAIALSRVPPPRWITGWAAGTAAVTPRTFFSPDADAFIRAAGLTGPVFNSLHLGGYLSWEFYPSVSVFQDSRLQAYPQDHFGRILNASETQKDWDALVAGVDWAVVSVPVRNELSGADRFPVSDWAPVFRDAAVTVFVRRSGRFGALPELGR
jgi:hypothetical protein